MPMEFRDFVMRGNVLDLAIAVILGAAFGAIITSLVNDILMPLIGIVMGGVDFAALTYQSVMQSFIRESLSRRSLISWP